MPLENVTTIADLVITNPADSDPLGLVGAHIRTIKSAVKATFPSVSAPVTASAADLNSIASLTSRIAALETTRAHRDVNEIFLGSVGVTGIVNAVGGVWQNGALLIPTGIIVMWNGSSASVPAGWALCDGTLGTPDFRNRFIIGAGASFTQYSTGGLASSTLNTAVAGSHNHAGSTAAAGGHGHSAASDLQGVHNHFTNTGSHVLTLAEIPPHSHTNSNGRNTNNGYAFSGSSNGSDATAVSTGLSGGGGGHTHPITTDGGHTHNISVATTPDHTHTINTEADHSHSVVVPTVPPYYAAAYIMKL